ncbi:MAG: uracil-DNA glycosylase [Deltaproteobacteria bacterium]|nr:uracil-DNA glycosylase [Deltaproteobacteria bacterium]
MSDPRAELRALTAQFRTRLAWSARWGALGVPGGASPRTLTVDPGPAQTPHDAKPAEEEIVPLSTGGEGACVGQAPAVHADGLALVREEIGDCQRCGLCQTRKNIVFGVGNPNADLVFVGEAPGGDEDAQGEPFVGAAGQLLTKMIEAMGFSRDSVYICNVIKCRPPGNRNPLPEEVAACEPFLKKQLATLQPRLIVALGKFAAHCLLRTETPITRLRGTWGTYEGIATMPTFHPAYLLRNPDGKRFVWQDLKAVLASLKQMGIEPPHPPRA